MRGFLPEINPLREYSIASPSQDRLQEIADSLPRLLLTSRVARTLESLQEWQKYRKLLMKKFQKLEALDGVQLSKLHQKHPLRFPANL